MSNTIFAQGNAAFQRSDFKAAYKHFTNALNLEPENVVLLDCRAATSQKLGHHKDALRDARLIVKCEPTQARGYIRLAKVLDAMNQKDKAQVILGVGSRRVPRTDKLYHDMSKRRKATHDIVIPSKNNWRMLPSELMWSIFSSLPLEQLVLCMRVCRHWHHFIKDTPGLWRNLTVTNHWSLNITTKSFKIYLGRTGSLGPHKIALGSVNDRKLDTQRVIKAILDINSLGPYHLDMSGWRVSMPDIRFLLKKKKMSLRYLNVSDLSLSDTVEQGPLLRTVIQEGQNLEHFEASKMLISKDVVESLPVRDSIKTLKITDLEVRLGMDNFLTLLPQLQYLYFKGWCTSRPLFIAQYILALPNIREFRLHLACRMPSGLLELSATQTKKIEQNSKNLTILSISYANLCDWELIAIMNGCSAKLLTLTLSDAQITDQAIQHISGLTLPRLQNLEISSCVNINSNALVLLINACPNLRNVVLNQLPATDDTVLKALARCNHLTTVDICQSRKVTGSGVRSIVSGTSSLVKFVAHDCVNIDLDSILYAQSKLSNAKCSFGSKPKLQRS